LFKRILVVLDPAKDMWSAKDYAIDLVKRWSPSVVALYTAFEEAEPFKAGSAEGIQPKMFVGNRALADFEKELRNQVGEDVDVTTVVEEGPYEVTIPSVAAREGVDLLVLGSFHARMERAIFGSDTERVIEYSPCSVLLVRRSTPLPEEGSTLVFAHDSPSIAPRAETDIVRFARATGSRVQPVLGLPQKGLETGADTAKRLADSLRAMGLEVLDPQVLTSRWVLGPHGVVHRAVVGMHPAMALLSRYPEAPWGNATHWLVHEFVADTPCPMLFMK